MKSKKRIEFSPQTIQRVTNNTSVVLFPRVREARGLWQQAVGLMFRRGINYALLFDFKRPARVWVTNIFVFTTLDLIFLDDEKRVLGIVFSFRPFTLGRVSPPDTRYLIEIPSVLRPLDLNVGDLLRF
jgi:uncharacterized membrane protein (UPF0127 family)